MAFIVYKDEKTQKVFILPENKMVVFGRENHVDFQILKDSEISREHFAIAKNENDNYEIIDLGSSNGTSLNGKKMESNAIISLKNDDEIMAGKQSFTFRIKPLMKPSDSQIVPSVFHEDDGFKTSIFEVVETEK
jgi:pSer/pThr/pTyr-binding forkhead associated (FHA) protein